MALVCLKLYRITGQRFYRDKARKIFTFLRSRMQYVADKDYYTWNYWDPFGPWDLNVEEGSARHWMNVHGYRNYQAGEVRQLVEAYHSGIVFTEKDIQRIINTNLKVMWNGDKAAPKYVNSNAELPVPPMTEEERKAREAEIAANPLSKEGRAGTLWTGLLDFDPTIRELYAAGLGGGNARAQIAAAYYNNVTAKRPAGFDRHHAAAVDVPQWPVSDCRSLTVAAVMPATVKRGVPSYVFCKARVPVELEVGLYDADGKQLGSPMYKGKVEGGTDGHAGVFFFEWRPQETLNRPLKGAYIVRWTVPDGHRDFPVTIQ